MRGSGITGRPQGSCSLGEGLGIGGEAGSVPAVVTGELSVQVGRSGALRQGSKPLWAVGAIPVQTSTRTFLYQQKALRSNFRCFMSDFACSDTSCKFRSCNGINR